MAGGFLGVERKQQSNREVFRCNISRTGLQQGQRRVLVQTGKGLGDNGIWRIGKLNGILYLPDVGSKTTSFCSAFAGIFASS